MSRRRDTNWSKDEITVLLDSITEITRTRAQDGKRTNSREVFEYAAKKMGEKGHTSRAEREKCRTKWKKMKEEFTHAKRAREGDSRFKEAPGIQPFYDRMEEFINGTFDNISPHSTIVRRTSSLSSSSGQASNGTNLPSSRHPPGMRASARLAANSNGTLATANETNPKDNANGSLNNPQRADYLGSLVEQQQSSDVTPSPRQNSSRLSSGSNNTNSSTTNNDNDSSSLAKTSDHSSTGPNNNSFGHHRTGSVATTDINTRIHLNGPTVSSSPTHQSMPKASTNGEINTLFPSYIKNTTNNNSNTHSSNGNNNEMIALNVGSSNHFHNLSMLTDATPVPPAMADHADISYRVSSGCRQITIFGDHDVDIKFRGDCVTINKIDTDHGTTAEI